MIAGMKIVRALEYTGGRAWEAMQLAEIDGVTARLHWTDEPYHWHANEGSELFTVLAGSVDMHYKERGGERKTVRLETGDSFVAEDGDEHLAAPIGEARILVVERAGSE